MADFENMKVMLFANDKASSDKAPTRTGWAEVDKKTLDGFVAAMNRSENGVIRLDAASWNNTSKTSDRKYQFIVIKEQDPKYATDPGDSRGRSDSGVGGGSIDDDDVPF